MVSRYAEADFAVDLEAACRGEEAKGWRTQGILRRQDNAAVVDAAGVGRGLWRTANGEMPLEQVLFQWLGMVICRRCRR